MDILVLAGVSAFVAIAVAGVAGWLMELTMEGETDNDRGQ